MDVAEAVRGLGVALAIGLMVGVERHWRQRDDAPGQRTAGIRTFGIIGLLGGLAANVGAWPPQPGWAVAVLIGVCFLGFSAALIVFKEHEARAQEDFSVTTVVAAQATFLLGALAVAGDLRIAAGAAVALTAVLASRGVLHALVSALSWPELRAAILLLSMTFVVLPLLPDQRQLWLAGLNPARIWLFAVILATVSFVGYGAVKILGTSRGLLLSGAAAGLVSSTAAVIANAREAGAGAVATLAASALIASGVSYARTALLAAALAPPLRGPLLVPLLAAAFAAALVAAQLMRKDTTPTAAASDARNPFELLSVLKIAALLAIVALLAEEASRYLGNAGLYVVAALSGLADVDAVTLSMTTLAPDQLTYRAAAVAILVAVVSNTAAKTVYALWLGGLRYGTIFGVGSLVALAVCFGAILVVPEF